MAVVAKVPKFAADLSIPVGVVAQRMPPFLKPSRARLRLRAKGRIRRGFEMLRRMPKIQQHQIQTQGRQKRPVVSCPIGNRHNLQSRVKR